MKPFYTIMFIFSLALFLASAAALAFYGLNLGVDFTGGSLMELEFAANRPSVDELSEFLKNSDDLGLSDVSVTPSGDRVLLIRMEEVSEERHQSILSKLHGKFPDTEPHEKRFDSIGPSIGGELKQKSVIAISILLAAVLLYIAYMFRALSKSLSLWAMSAGKI